MKIRLALISLLISCSFSSYVFCGEDPLSVDITDMGTPNYPCLQKEGPVTFCFDCGHKVSPNYIGTPKMVQECPICSSTNIRKTKKNEEDFNFETNDY